MNLTFEFLTPDDILEYVLLTILWLKQNRAHIIISSSFTEKKQAMKQSSNNIYYIMFGLSMHRISWYSA